MRDYFELTKFRVTSLVVFTTWLGYVLAGKPAYTMRWAHLLVGTWLVAASAAALNEYWERDLDAKMLRTQMRPLPQHRITPEHALGFSVTLAVIGLFELAIKVNWLSAFLAMITLVIYLFGYTPLKTKTALCTLVGAVPGAIPPMIGWAAVRGQLDFTAWVLFGIMFLWQLPHFLAIAWMYREDYARAGFVMLPLADPDGRKTAGMIVLYTVSLIPVSLIPVRLGAMGFSYFCGALFLGTAFLLCGACTAYFRTPAYAKRLLLASVIYLPLLLTWMALTRKI